MSTKHHNLDKEPEVVEFGVEELDDTEGIEEIGEAAEPKFGIVSNCVKLNIRTEPNIKSEILCMVDSGARLMIDPANSNDGWFNVYTNAGIEGYCMKEYVEIEE